MTASRDRYQLAGLDPRERGFSRPVELVQEGTRYRAALRYEAAGVVTAPAETDQAALRLLIATLHGQGYRQLKTQINFRNGVYLGSQEPWTEHPDPPAARRTVLAVIRNWLSRGALSP